jgi:hypothetical protein
VSTWGTAIFAYLRHDNIGSIIGTIDPVTHVPTDRLHLGTNFLTALTFTATDVGYGPNLFYYLRPAGTTLTTNNGTTFITNSATTYATNMVITGYQTNMVPTSFTTNNVVLFTPTNTVTAIGVDILLVSNVTAAANCIGPVAPAVARAPLAPVIGTPRMINGIFSLSFPTGKGISYTVQYKNTFTDPWTDLPGMPVSGTGGDLTITDPTAAGQPSRFYRVVVTP